MEGGVAFTLKPLSKPVDVLVGAVGGKTNPRSGKTMKTMEDSVTPTSMTVLDGFATTATRPVPREYLMQPSDRDLHLTTARLLKAHGAAWTGSHFAFKKCRFRRGFIEYVHLHLTHFLHHRHSCLSHRTDGQG